MNGVYVPFCLILPIYSKILKILKFNRHQYEINPLDHRGAVLKVEITDEKTIESSE